jgi:hypothetical protein
MKNKSGRSFGFPVFWSLLAIILLTAGSSAVFADFTPKTDLFSADKDTPLGFTNLVEPNVLLLIDTSSSMTERMSSGTSTYGDGTNPYNFGGSTTYYYFGTDQNSGRNTTGNNDASVDYNYHPLLRYIPEEILPSNTSYFSYDVVTETGERWENSRDGGFLPDGYRLNTSDGRLEIRYVWFIFTLWRNVEQNESKPEPPSGYRWDWQSGAWYLQKYGTYTETKNKYKYPNDSRMYTLKNVMYRILNDNTLVGNIRFALSSFVQTYVANGNTQYSPYSWSPGSTGNVQSISWQYPGICIALAACSFGRIHQRGASRGGEVLYGLEYFLEGRKQPLHICGEIRFLCLPSYSHLVEGISECSLAWIDNADDECFYLPSILYFPILQCYSYRHPIQFINSCNRIKVIVICSIS